MINVILPMAGNATRMPAEMITDIPKHLLPLPKGNSVLDLALYPITPLENFHNNIIFGYILPCGDKRRNKWGKVLRQYSRRHNNTRVYSQEILNGLMGAVLEYLEYYPATLHYPTMILCPDTIQNISCLTILEMLRSYNNWMTVTPKRWNGGDGIILKGNCIGEIYAEQEQIGYSPAGLLYIKDTLKLFGILHYLKAQLLNDIGFRDVINILVKSDIVRVCFIPNIIDCGTVDGYKNAVRTGFSTGGHYYWN